MRARQTALAGLGFALVFASSLDINAQQVPLAPTSASGQSANPVFEGWYRNPDGTYSLSFGYFSRNSQETLEIPIGPNNRIEPDGPNRGQPTMFPPKRHWGVFAVTVPADWGDKKVVWTLIVRGDTFAIPGSLKRGWEIDALQGEAGSGNTPPMIRFDSAGAVGRGPGGITVGPLKATVGTPLELSVWATDETRGRAGAAGRGGAPPAVVLTWFKHQGPGDVTFGDATPTREAASGKATTTATFGTAGDYILRIRATESANMAGAGHAQCCWTNSFVKVTVTR